MNALALKDLADKTRRGLRGRVEKGKAGGGLCYGYSVLKKFDAGGEPIRGDREIEEGQAEIVRRIFREFASGKSPRAIAVDLNGLGVEGPLGRAWGDTSIRGHVSRGSGILNNELYVGVLVWNRQRFIKNPSNGKRVSRMNPENQWIRTEVPHLRIVSDDLWQAAKKRQQEITQIFEATAIGVREARSKRLHATNRPVSLLSGLLICGSCGGRYGLIQRGRFGCLNHSRRGSCDNNRTVSRVRIEERVLSGLKDRMVSADSVAEAVRAYHEELNRLNHERRAQNDADRRSLDKIERSIGGIVSAIEDGMYQPAMKARMDELEREKAEIIRRLENAPRDLPDVHPNVANIYRSRISNLTAALNDPDGGREAAEALRSLIGNVVLSPGTQRGEVHAALRGELIGILELTETHGNARCREGMTAVAAGPRNQIQKSPPSCGLFCILLWQPAILPVIRAPQGG
ncbi:recombinase family protein, partial [Mesorhizobium australicum]|uniref:recombinase family protein n=1 Tax=Mesorhizobium australicum TaxID=536018 RepID=UPI00333D2FF9